MIHDDDVNEGLDWSVFTSRQKGMTTIARAIELMEYAPKDDAA